MIACKYPAGVLAGNHGTLDVDIKEFFPVFHRKFKGVAFDVHAHGVDENIDPAVFFHHGVHQMLDAGFIGHVTGNGDGRIPGNLGDLLGNALDGFLVSARDHHRGTMNPQPHGQCLADAAGTSRDNGNFAI